MGRKKKLRETEHSVVHEDPNSEVSLPEESPEEALAPRRRMRTKTKTPKTHERGSFAPFALTLSLMMIGALVFSIFYRPVSSSLIPPRTNEALRIFLNITTSEFATEGSASGSLEICKGTKEFPAIDKATVFVKDSNEKQIGAIAVKEATSKANSTCLYELTLQPVPNFPGTKLNVFVRFPFGDSNTFLVDVGSKPPYKKINIRLTLG